MSTTKKKPSKNTTKKKASKKKASAKKKATKKPAAKKSLKNPALPKVIKWDPLGEHIKYQDKHFGVKVSRKPVPVSKIDDFELALDTRTGREIEELLRRTRLRPEMFSRIKHFEKCLIEKLGRQIKVRVHLSDDNGVFLSTEFKPKKGQDPFDGDAVVMEVFKSCGLDRFLDHEGCGTMIATGVRDNDFIEKRLEFEKI